MSESDSKPEETAAEKLFQRGNQIKIVGAQEPTVGGNAMVYCHHEKKWLPALIEKVDGLDVFIDFDDKYGNAKAKWVKMSKPGLYPRGDTIKLVGTDEAVVGGDAMVYSHHEKKWLPATIEKV
eukprot:g6167.t1